MAGSTGKTIFDFGLLRRVLKFASPYKTKFFISLALAVSAGIFRTVRPLLIQHTINDYINGGCRWITGKKLEFKDLIIWITVIQIGLLLVESAFQVLFSFSQCVVGTNGGERSSCKSL